ncbi:Isopentenyl-diphosphate Delta-isomerase 1 [Dictyocoela roeselum]|nr:Isopentenyl-diphosphate Delta-isomerase 1 [Dictyocoela roeselum]
MDNYNKNIILVEENDKITGTKKAITAHRQKSLSLHRGFSIFIFSGEKMLIQKRSAKKLVYGGKWSNACCSHPFLNKKSFINPIDDCKDFAQQRLMYELGVGVELDEIQYVAKILYNSNNNDFNFKGKLLTNEISISDYKEYTPAPDEVINKNDEYAEHEIDYIFVINKSVVVNYNPEEVSDYRWVDKNEWNQIVKSGNASPWSVIICELMDIFELNRR